MSPTGWAQLAALALLLAVSTPLLGRYLHRVYFTEQAPGDRLFLPVERFVYRICGIDPAGEQRWSGYAFSLLAFSLISCLFSYLILRLQGVLPLNPAHLTSVSPGLSFNTAVSFLTGTNWQSYAGESTMSTPSATSSVSRRPTCIYPAWTTPRGPRIVAVAFVRMGH